MSGHTCGEPIHTAIGWGRTYACGAKAKVERDGRWYCLRHDPVARKAKADAKHEAAMAEARAYRAHLEAVAAEAAEAAEQRRRAECYDDLLDALRQWAAAERDGDAAELACARISRDAAIAKATGGAS